MSQHSRWKAGLLDRSSQLGFGRAKLKDGTKPPQACISFPDRYSEEGALCRQILKDLPEILIHSDLMETIR